MRQLVKGVVMAAILVVNLVYGCTYTATSHGTDDSCGKATGVELETHTYKEKKCQDSAYSNGFEQYIKVTSCTQKLLRLEHYKDSACGDQAMDPEEINVGECFVFSENNGVASYAKFTVKLEPTAPIEEIASNLTISFALVSMIYAALFSYL